MDKSIYCSIIIPTISRQSLSKAVESVLTQEFPQENIEVIVVNDSGLELPQEAWQASERVQVINTQKRERSFARNAGAAIARGKYLLFLDDDDTLLPNALNSFLKLSEQESANLYYGGYNICFPDGRPKFTYRPDETGNCLIRLLMAEWIPLQASMIEKEAFFHVGGYNPKMVPHEDIDFTLKMAYNHNFAVTNSVIFNYLVDRNTSTTDQSNFFDEFYEMRETILDMPSAFNRIRESACDQCEKTEYWKGRVSGIYFSSMARNWKHKRRLKAWERAFWGWRNIFSSGNALYKFDFWYASFQRHIPMGNNKLRGIL
jgi:glycosyltransferase involved in cell wall biosynthesis